MWKLHFLRSVIVKHQTPTIVVFLLIILSRILLFRTDSVYFFPDEIRYHYLSLAAEKSLSQNSILPYLQSIFTLAARPGFGITHAVPAFLDHNTGQITQLIPPYQADFVPQAFFGNIWNYGINILLLLVIYRFLRSQASQAFALSAIFVISLCSLSLSYVRHMLPYDSSLIFLMLAVIVATNKKNVLLAGLYSGLSQAVYPGHSYYIAALGLTFFIVVLVDIYKFPFKKFLKSISSFTLTFVVGFLVPLLFFELTSRLVGAESYLVTQSRLSETVTQGNFVFLGQFLTDFVMHTDGVVFLAFLLVGCILHFCYWRRGQNNFLFIYLFISFIVLEIVSHLLHITVLYGRTLRPLLLILFLFSLIGFETALRKIKHKNIILTLLFIVVASFSFFKSYMQLFYTIYPESVAAMQQKSNLLRPTYVHTIKESIDDQSMMLTLGQNVVYAQNIEYLYPYYGQRLMKCNKNVLYSYKHPMVRYPAYKYEGFDESMRSAFLRDEPRMEVFSCKP